MRTFASAAAGDTLAPLSAMARAQRLAGVEPAASSRRWPVGAEILPDGGVHFRVWAPVATRVEIVLESGPGAPEHLQLTPDGYFAGSATHAAIGPGTANSLASPRACTISCRIPATVRPSSGASWTGRV